MDTNCLSSVKLLDYHDARQRLVHLHFKSKENFSNTTLNLLSIINIFAPPFVNWQDRHSRAAKT